MADSVRRWSAEDCKAYLPLPEATDHKYRRGVLSCITGSNSYPGAALLTTSAALATGIGMVRYFGPRKVRDAVILNRPEIVLKPGKSDAFLIGSGFPSRINLKQRLKIKIAIQSGKPVALDAGALAYLKEPTELKSLVVITPHIGELAKLLQIQPKMIEANPEKYALEAAKRFNVTVLLKGHETIIANNKQLIKMPAASSWLATAGTGDVLAGILGGLITLNHETLTKENLIEVSASASYIHAICADTGPVIVSELVTKIPKIVTQLSM